MVWKSPNRMASSTY